MARGGAPLRQTPVDPAPLIGREREFARLERLLDAARAGVGGAALISGEGGVGKTHLARRLAAEARARSMPVAWGHAYEGAGRSHYWPWPELLRTCLALSGTRGARRPTPLDPALRLLVPELTASGPVGRSDPRHLDDQSELVDSVVTFLRMLSERQPLMLIVDDLQVVAEPGRALFRAAVQASESHPLVVLGTYRDDELTEGELYGSAPVDPRERLRATRVRLDPFSPAEVAAYLTAFLGAEPPSEITAAMHARTGGNALFVAELAALLYGGPTEPPIDIEAAIPDSVAALLDGRMRRLSPACAELLALAAIAGAGFSFAMLCAASSVSARDTLDLLDEALAARIVVEEGDGEYRFAHPVSRDALLARFSSARRAALHATVGDALERFYGVRAADHARELSHHFVQAGIADAGAARRAMHYSHLAAPNPEASAAWAEAAPLFDWCAQRSEAGFCCCPDADTVDFLLGAARCWQRVGEWRRAWHDLMIVLNRFRATGRREQFARAALIALEGIDARPERRASLAREALEAAGEDDPQLIAMLLIQLAGEDDTPEAARAAEQADRLARAHELPEVRMALARRKYLLQLGRGRVAEARDTVQRRLAWHRRLDDRAAIAIDLAALVDISLRAGELTKAQVLAEEAIAFAQRARLHAVERRARMALLTVALARAEFRRFDALTRSLPHRPLLQVLRARRMELTGDPAAGLALLPSRGGPDTDHPRIAWDVHGTRARLMWRLGCTAEARIELARWEHLRSLSANATDHLDSLSTVGDSLAPLASVALLTSVAEESAGWDDLRFAYHSASSLDRIRGQIAARLGNVTGARAHFNRAREWATRESAPVELASTLVSVAELDAREGATSRARAALREAATLFERHGAPLLAEDARARAQRLDGSAFDAD
ncbi:MAG: AAA family ATPase, partial [Dehalococcoidia bacterium]